MSEPANLPVAFSPYVPLYASLFEGSLRGKPNHQLVWIWIIANKNLHGLLDKHPRCCADATGLQLQVVLDVYNEFCQPDAESRSQEAEGRRLIPIEGRGFGWHVVNSTLYRDRARKREHDLQRAASGENKQRKAAKRRGPLRPDAARQKPLLDLDLDLDLKTESEKKDSEPPRTVAGGSRGDKKPESPRAARRTPNSWKRIPVDWMPDESLRAWAAVKAPDVDFDSAMEAIRDYEFTKLHTDADATFRTWLRTEQKSLAGRTRGNGAAHHVEPETKFERAKRRLREASE